MLGVYNYEYTGGCSMIKLSNIKLIKIIKMFILEISSYKNKKKIQSIKYTVHARKVHRYNVG